MKIEYVHDSKYGNGEMVADEFKKLMAEAGVTVNVHHASHTDPKQLDPADLYLFSSPGRFGGPKRNMRQFLKKIDLPRGANYALLTTEMVPPRDKKTGKMPTEDEIAKWQHVIPAMDKILQSKGLRMVLEDKIFVTAIKGPLEEDWKTKLSDFISRLLVSYKGVHQS
jgi:flavodoxin